jgi:hypothetical protein
MQSVVDHSSTNKIQEIPDNTFSTNRDSQYFQSISGNTSALIKEKNK